MSEAAAVPDPPPTMHPGLAARWAQLVADYAAWARVSLEAAAAELTRAWEAGR